MSPEFYISKINYSVETMRFYKIIWTGLKKKRKKSQFSKKGLYIILRADTRMCMLLALRPGPAKCQCCLRTVVVDKETQF